MHRNAPTRPGLYRLKDPQARVVERFTPETCRFDVFDTRYYSVERFDGNEWTEY